MGCECLTGIITLLVAVAGFIVTFLTIKKGNNNLRISNVLELKKMFNDYSDISSKLYPNGEWSNLDTFNLINAEDFLRFNVYAGVFEVAKLMLENDSLKKNEFETFFLYRLSNIATCPAAMENINQNIESWKNLIALMQMFDLPVENNN